MHWTETAEDSSTSRQRSEDAVAEPCPAQVTASSGAVVVVALGGATTEEALEAARDALERAAGPGEDVALAVPSGSEAGEELLTTREAAVALGISVSTARRWSDEGRLRTTKTTGGHRRFRVADLRGLSRSSAPRARLRLAEPPRVTLPATGRGPLPARHAARIRDALALRARRRRVVRARGRAGRPHALVRGALGRVRRRRLRRGAGGHRADGPAGAGRRVPARWSARSSWTASAPWSRASSRAGPRRPARSRRPCASSSCCARPR